MTREERLKFCSICKHQHMDMKRGIVCSLTNEYADFEENCEKYEPSDEFLKQQRAKTIVSRLKGKYTAENTFKEQYLKLKEELEAKYSSNSRIIN